MLWGPPARKRTPQNIMSTAGRQTYTSGSCEDFQHHSLGGARVTCQLGTRKAGCVQVTYDSDEK